MSNRSKAAALDFYGIPHGIKARAQRQLVDHPDLEKHVLRAVGELLAAHPRVLLAVRQNSGGASYEHSSGAYKPIFFYQILRPRSDLTVTDYWGIAEIGYPVKRAAPFAIECKRPSWNGVRSEREIRQQAFIDLIKEAGGVGGFVRNADEAHKLLA